MRSSVLLSQRDIEDLLSTSDFFFFFWTMMSIWLFLSTTLAYLWNSKIVGLLDHFRFSQSVACNMTSPHNKTTKIHSRWQAGASNLICKRKGVYVGGEGGGTQRDAIINSFLKLPSLSGACAEVTATLMDSQCYMCLINWMYSWWLHTVAPTLSLWHSTCWVNLMWSWNFLCCHIISLVIF